MAGKRAEGQSLVPRDMYQLTTNCKPSSRGTQNTRVHTPNTYTHIIKNNEGKPLETRIRENKPQITNTPCNGKCTIHLVRVRAQNNVHLL